MLSWQAKIFCVQIACKKSGKSVRQIALFHVSFISFPVDFQAIFHIKCGKSEKKKKKKSKISKDRTADADSCRQQTNQNTHQIYSRQVGDFEASKSRTKRLNLELQCRM